jgi:AraC-like DNA-binding protein
VPRLLEYAGRDTRYLTGELKFSFLSAFVARRTETVQAIRMPTANLLIVLEGTKRVWWAGRPFTYASGAAFAMPPGVSVDVVNEPDPRSGVYRALFLGFSAELLEEARRRFKPASVGRRPPNPSIAISDVLASAILHTSEALSGRMQVSDRVKEARTLEVLLLLAEMGALPLQPDRKTGTTAQAVRFLVRDKPAFNWTAGAVAAELGISESTLRRNLRTERTTFRAAVTDERMQVAHAMLQDGHRVTDAALVAGYASLSHFSKRFLASYGCLPSQLANAPFAAGAPARTN